MKITKQQAAEMLEINVSYQICPDPSLSCIGSPNPLRTCLDVRTLFRNAAQFRYCVTLDAAPVVR